MLEREREREWAGEAYGIGTYIPQSADCLRALIILLSTGRSRDSLTDKLVLTDTHTILLYTIYRFYNVLFFRKNPFILAMNRIFIAIWT